jgi:uncharacterized protein (DUF1778 family)
MAEQVITATEDEVSRIEEQIRRRREGSPQPTVSVSQSSEQQSIPASVAEENIIEQTPITQDNWWFDMFFDMSLDLPGVEGDRSVRTTDLNMFDAVITDTITFGLSEESSAAVLALIDKALDVSRGGDTSYSDFYRQNVSILENERLQWQEENALGTGAATVIGIAGSLPGAAAKTATRVSLPVVSNVLERISPRIAQVSAPLTSRAASVAERVTQATPQTIRTLAAGSPQAAAYGALAGFGYSLQGEDAEQAAFDGAKTAILFNTVFRGLGTGISALAQRRVERELGRGEDFVPLIAAGDSKLAKIYNSITQSLPIAGGMIKSQLDNLKKPLLTARDKAFAEIQERTGINQLSSIKKYVEDINTRIKGTAESIKNKVARGVKLDPEKELQIQRRYQTIESARANIVQGILNAKEKLFRTNIVKSSAPRNLSDDLQKEFDEVIETGRIQNAVSFLENAWKNGFGVIRDRDFTLNADDFIASIQNRMNKVDSEGFALLYGDKKINFDSTVKAFLEGKLDGNRISGQAISDLRNRYSREVRNLLRQGGEAAQRGFVLRNVLDEIDDLITKQLPKSGAAVFEAEKNAWRVYVNLLDATASASTKGGVRGAFTEDQWLQALKRNQSRLHVKGQGSFQSVADDLADTRARSSNILKKINENTKERMSIALNLEKQKVQESLANARANPTGTELENARLMQSYTETLGKIDEIDQLLKSGNPTISNLIGAGLGASGIFLGGLGSVATGAAMATMIGSQRFQRFLAGQTRVQRGISAISSEVSERLATGSAAVSGQIQARGIEETTPSEYRAIANSKNNNAKALAFKRVLELGQEQRLKRINRDAYTKLKSAYESVYSQ